MNPALAHLFRARTRPRPRIRPFKWVLNLDQELRIQHCSMATGGELGPSLCCSFSGIPKGMRGTAKFLYRTGRGTLRMVGKSWRDRLFIWI